MHDTLRRQRLSWSRSYGSWIYKYLCNQCLSLLTLWVETPLRRGLLDTTLCDKVCQLLETGWWLSLHTLVSSANETDHHYITEILLKVAFNIINQNIDWWKSNKDIKKKKKKKSSLFYPKMLKTCICYYWSILTVHCFLSFTVKKDVFLISWPTF